MGLRGRCVAMATVTGVLLALLPAVAISGVNPTMEAVNTGLYSHHWSPAQVSVSSGGAVTLSNTTAVPHGVEWVGGPVKPECDSGVPVGTTAAASGKDWSGTCTFTHAGTYTFYCTVHGPEMTGTITVTTPGAPIVSTGEADAVGQTEASVHGTVNPQGKATSYYFNYGKTASYGERTSEEPAEEVSVAEPVAVEIATLTPGTVYHYQLVAKNGAGTTEGVDRTFTTITPPGPPSASTGSATALGETLATLNGTVNPDGEATKYLFEWGASSQYGHSTEELPAGEDRTVHAESSDLTGLTPETVYHFRLVTMNTSGTVPGLDETFTTSAPPSTTPSSTPTASTPALPTAAQSAPTPMPVLTTALGPPIVGSPLLRATQHGASVKGSLQVSAGAAGARLEIDVFARGASIASTGSSSVLVGRLIRGAVSAGSVSFVVKLDARARNALRRRHSLKLTVRITLTPKGGHATSITRGVLLAR